MPANELPLYPTPQQATYGANGGYGSPSNPTRKQGKPSSNGYRQPPMNQQPRSNSNGYGHPQQQYQQNIAPTPQQYYQQHPVPTKQYHQPAYNQPVPQQQQPPPQQQYYQPQPAPQPPQPVNYHQQPAPSHRNHAPPQQQQQQPSQLRYQDFSQPPRSTSQSQISPQQANYNGSSQSGNYSSSPQQQQGYSNSSQQGSFSEQGYNGSSQQVPHKKPPPVAPASPTHSNNRSKESLVTAEGSGKSKNKQKLELELRSVFEKVDTNNSGRISARELSSALLNFDHTRFQDSTIELMIKLFSSTSSSGQASRSLNFDQFVSLWKYLSAYKKLFITADTNKSGTISFGEFQKIIEQIGYKLNIDLVLHLFQKFSNKGSDDVGAVGKLKFDSFIELLVYLRKLTDIFKKYDKDLSGVATINFSDFLFEISSLS